MARTVADVLKQCYGNGVLVLRHGRYENRHVVAACNGDPWEMYAQNYSRRVPDSFFPLNAKGYEESLAQGKRFVELGIVPSRIATSANGRGPHTAIAIADGIAQARGEKTLPPIHHDACVDYPIYRYEGLAELMGSLEKQYGDFGSNRMVAEWVNGKRDGQCLETPGGFVTRSRALISDAFAADGFRIAVGHFELIVLLHGLYVAKERPGTIPETWWPAYNQGVLIVVAQHGKFTGYDVAPDLTIIE